MVEVIGNNNFANFPLLDTVVSSSNTAVVTK